MDGGDTFCFCVAVGVEVAAAAGAAEVVVVPLLFVDPSVSVDNNAAPAS